MHQATKGQIKFIGSKLHFDHGVKAVGASDKAWGNLDKYEASNIIDGLKNGNMRYALLTLKRKGIITEESYNQYFEDNE